MSKLVVDEDKYSERSSTTAVVEAFHNAMKSLVRQKLDEHNLSWDEFVFDKSYELITAEEFAAIEQQLLDAGHRFDWSAAISVKERPDAYTAADSDDDADFCFEHPEASIAETDEAGRELRGHGDNVVKFEKNISGTARYVRSSTRVLQWLTEGVPADTIAFIDDSGGTLTAPILDQFKAIVCAGGTTRSHLGILSREFGIPCLMNAKVNGVKEGDSIEVEYEAQAKTTEDYQAGKEVTSRVWRLHK